MSERCAIAAPRGDARKPHQGQPVTPPDSRAPSFPEAASCSEPSGRNALSSIGTKRRTAETGIRSITSDFGEVVMRLLLNLFRALEVVCTVGNAFAAHWQAPGCS